MGSVAHGALSRQGRYTRAIIQFASGAQSDFVRYNATEALISEHSVGGWFWVEGQKAASYTVDAENQGQKLHEAVGPQAPNPNSIVVRYLSSGLGNSQTTRRLPNIY